MSMINSDLPFVIQKKRNSLGCTDVLNHAIFLRVVDGNPHMSAIVTSSTIGLRILQQEGDTGMNEFGANQKYRKEWLWGRKLRKVSIIYNVFNNQSTYHSSAFRNYSNALKLHIVRPRLVGFQEISGKLLKFFLRTESSCAQIVRVSQVYSSVGEDWTKKLRHIGQWWTYVTIEEKKDDQDDGRNAGRASFRYPYQIAPLLALCPSLLLGEVIEMLQAIPVFRPHYLMEMASTTGQRTRFGPTLVRLPPVV
ncbi:hypothetical protein RB195_001268 [Necator americanus]|uniref:Uncharacterized protein n=1 Tax=Necator americanus TaxID=51031 RepID=A0ABR1DE47_NECAM